MELDALTAFLDGDIHLSRRRLRSLMIADGIEIQYAGKVIFVSLVHLLDALIVRETAVVVDVVIGLGLVEGT
jgi:hypothetical protein